MDSFWYLFSGYLVIWVLISLYFINLGTKTKELSLRLDKLEAEKND